MLKNLWQKFWYKILTRNKFIITLILFVLWVGFFDKNNLWDRRKYIKQIEQLRADKAYYQEQIESDSAQLYKLKNNPELLERFAREHYYMKAPDEDLFIIQVKKRQDANQ